jgi:hypothetical protein
MSDKSVGEIITLVFKAIAMAMAVAVVVLNILGVAPVETQTLLLGFGLFGVALAALQKE